MHKTSSWGWADLGSQSGAQDRLWLEARHSYSGQWAVRIAFTAVAATGSRLEATGSRLEEDSRP